MKSEIRAAIRSIASDACLDDFTDSDSLFDLGVLDSLAIMQLVPILEEKFKVRVAMEELLPENFDSVAKMESFIGIKTAAARK